MSAVRKTTLPSFFSQGSYLRPEPVLAKRLSPLEQEHGVFRRYRGPAVCGRRVPLQRLRGLGRLCELCWLCEL